MKRSYRHKLAVMGDSISQGFQSSAIYRTELSFPAMLASALDPSFEFRQARFSVRGGIPLNLEFLLRTLERSGPPSLDWKKYPAAVGEIFQTIRKTKQYWEGDPSVFLQDETLPYHNQSVWGLSVSDAWHLNDALSEAYIANHRVRYSVFNFLPDHALYTTARCVLNPSGWQRWRTNTMLDNLKELSDDGGIEHLIVHLGSNHIVGAITKLRVSLSEEDEIEALPYQRTYTVLRPEHFQRNYKELAQRISKLRVKHVIVATIPYVTSAPAIQGYNEGEAVHSLYSDYYFPFWADPSLFNPELHPHLTRKDAIDLDIAVDQFNTIIRNTAEKMGWILVDVNKSVALIDYRRHKGKVPGQLPQALYEALKLFPETSYLAPYGNTPTLDTRYLKTDPETNKIMQGGIFSLDGLHPTTIGYGLIADLFYEEMKKSGIVFRRSLNWNYIVQNDTLITEPPRYLSELSNIYRLFASVYDHARKFSDPDALVEPLFGFWRNLRKVWGERSW